MPSIPHNYESPNCSFLTGWRDMSRPEHATHVARAASPYCAPSRPNTPCSTVFPPDAIDPPEQLPFTPADGIRGFYGTRFTAVTSDDTGSLLALATLAICLCVLYTGYY
jgi:hypothetical protein